MIFYGFMVFGAAGHDQSHPAPPEEALFWARGGMLRLGQIILTLLRQNLHSAASLICCQPAQLSDAEDTQISLCEILITGQCAGECTASGRGCPRSRQWDQLVFLQ